MAAVTSCENTLYALSHLVDVWIYHKFLLSCLFLKSFCHFCSSGVKSFKINNQYFLLFSIYSCRCLVKRSYYLARKKILVFKIHCNRLTNYWNIQVNIQNSTLFVTQTIQCPPMSCQKQLMNYAVCRISRSHYATKKVCYGTNYAVSTD